MTDTAKCARCGHDEHVGQCLHDWPNAEGCDCFDHDWKLIPTPHGVGEFREANAAELAELMAEIKMLPWPSPTTLDEAITGLRECSWWVCDRLSDPPISAGWKHCANENEAFIRAHIDALEAKNEHTLASALTERAEHLAGKLELSLTLGKVLKTLDPTADVDGMPLSECLALAQRVATERATLEAVARELVAADAAFSTLRGDEPDAHTLHKAMGLRWADAFDALAIAVGMPPFWSKNLPPSPKDSTDAS